MTSHREGRYTYSIDLRFVLKGAESCYLRMNSVEALHGRLLGGMTMRWRQGILSGMTVRSLRSEGDIRAIGKWHLRIVVPIMRGLHGRTK